MQKKPMKYVKRECKRPARLSTPTDKWLSRQSEWFIEESLGVSRAALFTKGGMSLSSFTDLSLRPLTLAQLRAVDAKAFELAGL